MSRCEASVDYVVTPSQRWGGGGTFAKYGQRRCSRQAFGERPVDSGLPYRNENDRPVLRVCRQHLTSRYLFEADR